MKKYLLPQEGRFYKANLHSHSTISDGELTPEKLKEIYKARGYSILAYTDHNVMIPHFDLADDEFLPLVGYELDVTGGEAREMPYEDRKVCHMCLIALEPDNLKQVCWHRSEYLYANTVYHKDEVQFYEDEPDYIRVYHADCINDIVKTGREYGFFVTYNHPSWSCEGYEEYSQYKYFNAMEICNYGTLVTGHGDYNPRVYDDMLKQGKRLYCVGTDDNHNWPSREWDSFGAWVMIKAGKLEYRTITKALEDGNFYSSQGPEIYELWVEDNKLHIVTSEVSKISLSSANRRADSAWADTGKTIHSAVFELDKDMIYFRITVVDHQGKCANTNAYFLDDIMS